MPSPTPANDARYINIDVSSGQADADSPRASGLIPVYADGSTGGQVLATNLTAISVTTPPQGDALAGGASAATVQGVAMTGVAAALSSTAFLALVAWDTTATVTNPVAIATATWGANNLASKQAQTFGASFQATLYGADSLAAHAAQTIGVTSVDAANVMAAAFAHADRLVTGIVATSKTSGSSTTPNMASTATAAADAVLFAFLCIPSMPLAADPTIAESGWTLVRTVSPDSTISPAMTIYVYKQNVLAGAVYDFSATISPTKAWAVLTAELS